MNEKQYWVECISQAFDEGNIVATKKQIEVVAEMADNAHKTMDLYSGAGIIQNPQWTEVEVLRRKIKRMRNQQVCRVCKGKGEIVEKGIHHYAISDCQNCGGNGIMRTG